jgi:hypothetical protein
LISSEKLGKKVIFGAKNVHTDLKFIFPATEKNAIYGTLKPVAGRPSPQVFSALVQHVDIVATQTHIGDEKALIAAIF